MYVPQRAAPARPRSVVMTITPVAASVPNVAEAAAP
jgi:hypothetical protein